MILNEEVCYAILGKSGVFSVQRHRLSGGSVTTTHQRLCRQLARSAFDRKVHATSRLCFCP